MEKNVLVVCDLEVEYASRLMDFLSIKRNVPFEVYTFTKTDGLLNYSTKQKVDVLLISEPALKECEKEICQKNIGEIFVLNEDGDIAEYDGYKAIYKYQNTDNILREVMCYYAESSKSIKPAGVKTEGYEMIAVYSPVRRSLKTSFAMTIGQILSQSKRVLYINLEDYAGFNQMMKVAYMTDMSDLMYYISQGKPNFIWKLASMVQSIGGLDYIPPAMSTLDIRKITKQQWMDFFKELEKCEYDVVLLDMDDCVDGIYDILNMCSHIYTPVRDDAISYAKLEQYEALLKIMEYDEILERTRKLSFNYFKGVDGGWDRLIYSELGPFARKVLIGDGLL